MISTARQGALGMLVTLVLLTLPHPLEASLPAVPPEVDGSDALAEATDLIYSERFAERTVERLLMSAGDSFRELESDQPLLGAYWRARHALIEATMANQAGDSRGARRAAEDGFKFIERSLQEGTYSDGLRVVADLHSQMMMARGIVYMMRNGDDAREAALTALELDPDNENAMISVAGFYLNAPAFAGGDLEAAREILERAVEHPDIARHNRYVALGMLASARRQTGDSAGAAAARSQAVSIYGETEWLRETAGEAD